MVINSSWRDEITIFRVFQSAMTFDGISPWLNHIDVRYGYVRDVVSCNDLNLKTDQPQK